MKRKNTIMKLLSTLIVGIFCATPLVISADAAPRNSSERGRNSSQDRNNRNRYQTYTGTVTDVDDDSEDEAFEFRVGRKEYEVYLSGRTPRQLRKGDEVRVYGWFDGDDEIHNANVTILRSGNSKDGGWADRRRQNVTITGEVTKVGKRSFELRDGKRSYEVHPSGQMPRQLSTRDRVRVYGQVDGGTKIRNANVRIIGSGSGRLGWNDRNQRSQYRTLTGTVIKIRSNSFDLRADNMTYKVSLFGKIPNSLGKNDIVRVYGQVYDNNEIRNANLVIVRKR